MSELERLAGSVRRALEPGPAPERLVRQRQALLDVDPLAARRSRFVAASRGWWALPIAVAVASAVVVVAVSRREEPVAVAPVPPVAPPAPQVEVIADDEWLQAPDDGPLSVELARDSEARLSRGTRGRLQRHPKRVRMTVERGRVDVDIRPGTGLSYTFAAGAYRVQVLGTAFFVSYEPNDERVAIGVTRGKVAVSGGLLGDETVTLTAGHALRAAPGGMQLGALAPEPARPPQRPPVARDLPASWRERLDAGDYRGALAAAERDGFAQLVRHGTPATLLDLADTARLAGVPARAREALEALRQRFPRAEQAPTAAFLIGRLEADGRNDFARASSWFERYLRERPTGPYAAEALGRLIVARQRLGDASGAREAARRYLERYPHGPYEDLARALVSGPP